MSTKEQRDILHHLIFGNPLADLRAAAKSVDGGIEGVATWAAGHPVTGGISGEQLIADTIARIKAVATEL